jgi:hypothetical protein
MKRCGNLIKQGFVSKAVKCLQEKALPIPKNVENKDRLKDLHPSDRHTMGDMREDGSIADIIFDQAKINALPHLNVEPVVVSRNIRYLKRMKAPSGTTSTRNEHVQDWIRGPEGDIGLADVTWLVEVCISDDVPEMISLFMSYGELTEISKPHDPDGIRPITVCETIRKLCFMVLLDMHQLECDRYFEGTNYAVNGPNGIDKLNHLYRESMERQPGFDTIILEAKAAYQNFNRKEALREILEHVSGMFKIFLCHLPEENIDVVGNG